MMGFLPLVRHLGRLPKEIVDHTHGKRLSCGDSLLLCALIVSLLMTCVFILHLLFCHRVFHLVIRTRCVFFVYYAFI